MNRPHEQSVTNREARPVYPWVEAALRAEDTNAFLLGLGKTEFAVLLAELDAMRLSVSATGRRGLTLT